MHPFDSVLSAMRLESSMFVRLIGRAPWGISFDSGAQARLVVIARGTGWLTRAGQQPVQLAAGDCLIIRQGTEGVLSDAPGRAAVSCWDVADHVTGRSVAFGGDGDGAACEFFSTVFGFDHEAGEPLAALLPDVVHVAMPADEGARMIALLEQIGEEEAGGALGGGPVVGRLLDILFIRAIRIWAASEGAMPGGWLAGLAHPRLGPVLRRVHADLAHPWTLAGLARDAAMSRSSFAALFRTVVGEPPLAHVSAWRIYRARMLLTAGETIATVAARTGYGTDIAFSRAFKAATGLAPGQWRRARLAAGPADAAA